MTPRQIAFAAGIALAAMGLFLAALWSPERQVRLHQENLLEAVADRDWERLTRFMADDYSDRWGQDKANIIDAAREAFGQFVFLKISMEEPAVSAPNETGRVVTKLKVQGQGGPIAHAVVEEAAELRQPFTFDWQRQSWKPWNWALVRMDQRELEIPEL